MNSASVWWPHVSVWLLHGFQAVSFCLPSHQEPGVQMCYLSGDLNSPSKCFPTAEPSCSRFLVAGLCLKPLSWPLFISTRLAVILLGFCQIPGLVALPTSQVAYFLHVSLRLPLLLPLQLHSWTAARDINPHPALAVLRLLSSGL